MQPNPTGTMLVVLSFIFLILYSCFHKIPFVPKQPDLSSIKHLNLEHTKKTLFYRILPICLASFSKRNLFSKGVKYEGFCSYLFTKK